MIQRTSRQPAPIPALLRTPFEFLFGADLRYVRLHLDSPTAVALGARAFAWRDEIHFAPGAYDPLSNEGWRTLGHELAHVIQQRCGRVPQRAWGKPLHNPRFEDEADLAGRAAAAMYESARPPLPLHLGGKVPSKHVGGCAVQCLMTDKAFKDATDASGLRDKIVPVDRALKRFHELDKFDSANHRTARPRDYVAILAQLRTLYQACLTYKQKRPDSKRLPGVETLMKQIALEEAFLTPLAAYYREPDLVRQFEHLEEAQEMLTQLERRPDFTRATYNGQEVIDLINKHEHKMDVADRGSDVVQREIVELRKLADRATLPNILKSIIIECTAMPNTRQIDKKLGLPGAMYNTRNGAVQKYTLKHSSEQYLGKKFRMGSLLHELTHVSIAETFNNTTIMLAIKPTATDAEMLALATARNLNIARLQGLLATSTTLGDKLKQECIDKAAYATSNKISSYITSFKASLGDGMVARLKNLLAQGMRSELIEYDTVINQMALWCHLWGVAENDPPYAELLSLAREAYQYRANYRHFAGAPLFVPVLPRRQQAGGDAKPATRPRGMTL